MTIRNRHAWRYKGSISDSALNNISTSTLNDAIAELTGLLMDIAASEEAKGVMVVDRRARWTVGVYLRATESESTGRGTLRAAAIRRRVAGMREVEEEVHQT